MNELPTIYLDMDGTIADLYSVPHWLEYLLAEDTTPYRAARPLLNEKQIDFLETYIEMGGSVSIISWTSKTGSRRYNQAVRSAKVNWLKKNLPLAYAEIHVIKYGTPKSKFGKKGDILIDDEGQNIMDFFKNGKLAFHPNQWEDMENYLIQLVG